MHSADHPQKQASYVSYLIGFSLALGLSLLAFLLVCAAAANPVPVLHALLTFLFDEQVLQTLPHALIKLGVLIFALLQGYVHLRYFLHLDFSLHQRLNLQTICFTLAIIFILASGTLWIMQDLNQQM
jgi:cytochrome o ubiquinol oxidase operon protein cyoD